MCREADGSVDGAPSKKLKSDPDASAVVSFNYSNWSNLSVLLHAAMVSEDTQRLSGVASHM